ncbi:Trp operon leader peptide [Vibrio cholerae]|nr:trp operon leader peptide [Vibrio cholerae]EGQ7977154.1 Trp operon leader peptide [Vibrio cholerae]EGQ8528127.1 Trp operon leader peptide [Vibrio cholerae]EGQ8557313.1 Trp operon leader peptide [Vibrio cholerae]EGR2588025.1 Trp operon leader peptide [Vibrio cholerae]EJL6340273.1 Trp operon leader peptide [Vibrio cholerae]
MQDSLLGLTMLQEFNPNHKSNFSPADAELAWWRTWTSSWWAHVYF